MIIPDSTPRASSARRKRTPAERTAPVRQMTSMLRGKAAAKERAAKSGNHAPSMPVAASVPVARSKAAEANPANMPVVSQAARGKAANASAANMPVANVAARGKAGSPGSSPAATGAAEGPEDRAVRSGYEICEAAIRRGQDAARRLAPSVAEMTSGLKEVPGAKEAFGLAEGAFRVWADLATAWMRAVLPLAPAGFPDPLHLLESLRGAVAESAPAEGNAASRGRAVGFVVVVASKRPARITFELTREHDLAALAVQPLQPLDRDPAKLAILGVELRPTSDARGVEVHLTISDAQPPGRYLGAVHDKQSGAFVGGLTVDLQA